MTTLEVHGTTRLERDDALDRFEHRPLLEMGLHAFEAKSAIHGNRISFIRNIHLNPTNLCVLRCRFCDFAAKPGSPHAYSMTEDEIMEKLSDMTLREAHIVGGLWHTWGFGRSLALVRRIRAARPDLWIKAFTAVEVDYFSRMERLDWATVIREMRDAGVDAMPGGGAEVLSERIHQELYPDKIGPEAWLAVHETAHHLGLPTNATLLFGHIETGAEIVDHLLRLRALQDRTGGFQSFIPLAYQPGQTALTPRLVSVPQCLRVIALARLMLDNFAHIKAYWPALGIETAVAALSFGADDLDGTLERERIMHLAGSNTPERLASERMRQMIFEAGQIPVERDGRFSAAPAPDAAAV